MNKQTNKTPNPTHSAPHKTRVTKAGTHWPPVLGGDRGVGNKGGQWGRLVPHRLCSAQGKGDGEAVLYAECGRSFLMVSTAASLWTMVTSRSQATCGLRSQAACMCLDGGDVGVTERTSSMPRP